MVTKILQLTINVENLTKSPNRKWMCNRPEIESHGMGPRVNAVYLISRGCENCPLTINVENLTKSVNRKWMSDRPEIKSHGIGPCINAVYQYQVAVISSCWENCCENFLPLTINVENLTKSADRMWMGDMPFIESHCMGPHGKDPVTQFFHGFIS
jgi:hypothetical protein